MICDGREEKYCIRCGDEIKYHQMKWGCAVVHEGTECEGSCRCDCDCTPCVHRALGIAKREGRRWREMMAKQKQYIRPYENDIKAQHIQVYKRSRTKEKIKVPTTTRK